MRLFVSEYVCSGAWPDATLPESLAREGRAMLLALVEDAARIPQWEVRTTWDRRLGDFPVQGVSALIVDGESDEQAAFDRLARESDASYVIAPELDNLLTQRCQRVVDVGGRSLNSSIPAISLCSDKLRLARRLEEANVATLPTKQLGSKPGPSVDFPVVVKPRFGAGSQDTFLVETRRRFDEVRLNFADEPAFRQAIVQPFVKGMAVSIAAFIDRQGQVTDVGPVVEQLLSVDGRFTYLGGRISGNVGCDDAIRQLALDAVSAATGLRGYVGIDILIPCQRREPLLVEINPRLTTSYIGYRALTAENLAGRVLQPDVPGNGIRWTGERLLFTSHGSVNHTPRQGAEPLT
jgi:predicted ATP-grasp superfamily ATP-dependent carboligase